MSDFTDEELAAFRDRLEAERAEILAQNDAAGADRAPVALDQQSVGRLSRMDAMQVQAMAKAVEGRRKQALQQITAALTRMDEDEFGYCISCGELIARKRLDLDPKTATYIGCAA